MMRPGLFMNWLGLLLVAAGSGLAQTPAEKGPLDTRSAPALVRDGNKLLLSDKPADALRLYEQAEEKQPDAGEIAFVQGLGHYKLGEYDQAKAAFQEAAAAEDRSLADDALYSVGTCDHAAALAEGADPKEAMGRLESAMQSYQDVLSRDPQHQAARESNLKAATMWRQIKQQLEQQQEQEQQEQRNNESQEQQDHEQQQEQQQQQDSQQQENKEQQQSQSEEGDQEKEDQQQSSSAQEEQEQQQEQQSQAGEQQEQETTAQEQQQAQQEHVSRQQAERQLREMMQALKDRQKVRREQPAPVPLRRAEKDW